MMHFCSRIFDYANMRAEDLYLSLLRRFEIMKKLYTSKTFLKMAGGRIHTFHSNPLGTLLALIYGNHQKNLAYFCLLAQLILFFFTKRQSQMGRGGHGTMLTPPPKYAPVRNSCVLLISQKCSFLLNSNF